MAEPWSEDEFRRRMAARRGVPVGQLDEHIEIRPCDCDDEWCHGWVYSALDGDEIDGNVFEAIRGWVGHMAWLVGTEEGAASMANAYRLADAAITSARFGRIVAAYDDAASTPAITTREDLVCPGEHLPPNARLCLIFAHVECDHSALASKCDTPHLVDTEWLDKYKGEDMPP